MSLLKRYVGMLIPTAGGGRGQYGCTQNYRTKPQTAQTISHRHPGKSSFRMFGSDAIW